MFDFIHIQVSINIIVMLSSFNDQHYFFNSWSI